MSDEAAFLAAIKAAPDDNTVRQVYADWLDEQKRPGGRYLRVECELATIALTDPRRDLVLAALREAGEGIDPDWLAGISRVPVKSAWTPEVDVNYVIVRVEAGFVLYGFFIRSPDGSLAIVPTSVDKPGSLDISRSNAGPEWPLVQNDVARWGYVELADAKKQGIVPFDWEVPAGANDVGVVSVTG